MAFWFPSQKPLPGGDESLWVIRRIAEYQKTPLNREDEEFIIQALQAGLRQKQIVGWFRVLWFLLKLYRPVFFKLQLRSFLERRISLKDFLRVSEARFGAKWLLDFAKPFRKAQKQFQEIDHLKRFRPQKFSKPVRRVLFLTGQFPSIAHAGGLRLFDLLMELSKTYEIDLFSYFNPNQDSESFSLLKTHLKNIELNLTAHQFTSTNLLKWVQSRGRSLNDYDIIHLEHNQVFELLPALDHVQSKIIYCMTENIHRARFMELQQHLQDRDPMRVVEAWFLLAESLFQESRMWSFADNRLALTVGDGQLAQLLFGYDFKLIPSGVSDHQVWHPLQKNLNRSVQSGLVGFVGYFSHPPNILGVEWYLKNVHPLVKSRVPGYKFRVIGGGSTESLKKLAGGDSTVEFTGFVEDLTQPLIECEICVSPLVSGAGFRGKLNQYSAAQKATVTTSIGVDGLGYQNNVSAFVRDEAHEFAQCVVELLNSSSTRIEMARKAHQHCIDQFSWQKIVPRLIHSYEN